MVGTGANRTPLTKVHPILLGKQTSSGGGGGGSSLLAKHRQMHIDRMQQQSGGSGPVGGGGEGGGSGGGGGGGGGSGQVFIANFIIIPSLDTTIFLKTFLNLLRKKKIVCYGLIAKF